MPDYSQHLAVQANLNSVRAASAKDKQAWLALFHEDAVVSDPVGPSPFDPAGQGHRGKAAIEAFYDNVIAGAALEMKVGKHRVASDFACAVPMTAVNDLGEGVSTEVDMITIYHVDEQGLILSLHAYWDWAALEKQVAAIFAAAD